VEQPAPANPPHVDSNAGLAVNTITVPSSTDAEQSAVRGRAQLIPVGLAWLTV
jgi:hypothetical protein